MIVSFVNFDITNTAHSERPLVSKTKLIKTIGLIATSNSTNIKATNPVRFNRKSTQFSGRWRGSFRRISSSCIGAPNVLNFVHIINMRGNRVAVSTNHDGIFYGISRDKGRRIELAKEYTANNGVRVQIAMIYDTLNKNSSRAIMGVAVSTQYKMCEFYYLASARRF
jgi:hypothetical protein